MRISLLENLLASRDVGSRQGWGRLSCAAGTAPLLLSLAEDAGAEIPALPLAGRAFPDEEQHFPQGALFAHDVTWAVTRFWTQDRLVSPKASGGQRLGRCQSAAELGVMAQGELTLWQQGFAHLDVFPSLHRHIPPLL